MRPSPGNWVAIGRAVVYCAQAAYALSAGITCRHCRYDAPTTIYTGCKGCHRNTAFEMLYLDLRSTRICGIPRQKGRI